MDLSFSLAPNTELDVLPADLAALMVNVVARQATSTTARTQAGFILEPIDARLFAPLDGAFNGPVARSLMSWKRE